MEVSPPPIRTPRSFAKDREIDGYFRELHTFLRQLWARTGGSDDGIDIIQSVDALGSNISGRLTAANRKIQQMDKKISVLQGQLQALRAERKAHDALKVAMLKRG